MNKTDIVFWTTIGIVVALLIAGCVYLIAAGGVWIIDFANGNPNKLELHELIGIIFIFMMIFRFNISIK